MNEHSLLACPPMVMALLRGHKTQTRRVVAPHNSLVDGRGIGATGDGRRIWDSLVWATAVAKIGGPRRAYFRVRDGCGDPHMVTPRVRSRDVLWFKERHAIAQVQDPRRETAARVFYPANYAYRSFRLDQGVLVDRFAGEKSLTRDVWTGWTRGFKWRPSIHMPRWACRIVREALHVEATFVQSIQATDAFAEGLSIRSKDGERTWKFGIPDRDGWPGEVDWGWPWSEWTVDGRDAFRKLWDSINAERGLGWDINPPVWAYHFKEL